MDCMDTDLSLLWRSGANSGTILRSNAECIKRVFFLKRSPEGEDTEHFW